MGLVLQRSERANKVSKYTSSCAKDGLYAFSKSRNNTPRNTPQGNKQPPKNFPYVQSVLGLFFGNTRAPKCPDKEERYGC